MPAKDGHVALVYQEKDWPALRDVVGDARLHDERFASRTGRRVNRTDFLAILADWFGVRTRTEITAAMQARRVPIGPVLWPAELLDDPQYRARGFLAADGTPALPLGWNGARVDAREAADVV